MPRVQAAAVVERRGEQRLADAPALAARQHGVRRQAPQRLAAERRRHARPSPVSSSATQQPPGSVPHEVPGPLDPDRHGAASERRWGAGSGGPLQSGCRARRSPRRSPARPPARRRAHRPDHPAPTGIAAHAANLSGCQPLENGFAYGVASGEVTRRSVRLWTHCDRRRPPRTSPSATATTSSPRSEVAEEPDQAARVPGGRGRPRPGRPLRLRVRVRGERGRPAASAPCRRTAYRCGSRWCRARSTTPASSTPTRRSPTATTCTSCCTSATTSTRPARCRAAPRRPSKDIGRPFEPLEECLTLRRLHDALRAVPHATPTCWRLHAQHAVVADHRRPRARRQRLVRRLGGPRRGDGRPWADAAGRRAAGLGVLDAERASTPAAASRSRGPSRSATWSGSCCSRPAPTATAATSRPSSAARSGRTSAAGSRRRCASRPARGPSWPAPRCSRASTARTMPDDVVDALRVAQAAAPDRGRAVPRPLGQLPGRAGLAVRRDGRVHRSEVRACSAETCTSRSTPTSSPAAGRRPRVDDLVHHLAEPRRQEGLGQERRVAADRPSTWSRRSRTCTGRTPTATASWW